MHAQFCHTKSNAIVTLPHASHIAALLGFDMIVRCLQRPPLWFSDGGRRFDSGRSGSLSEKGEKRKRLAVDRNVGTPKRSPGGQNYPGALHYCARYSVPRFTKRMRRIKVPEHFSKKKMTGLAKISALPGLEPRPFAPETTILPKLGKP